MSTSAVAGYPRFHAIVAAKPYPEMAASVVIPQPESSYELYGGARFHEGKRRRDSSSAAGPSSNKRGSKRDADDEGGSSREPTTQYLGHEDLLKALRQSFQKTAHVDFNGTYETQVVESLSHKERIQSVANDIWKATGYRFTVKDHPQFTNGFKTRFWCSQDDAHRSKSSRAARKAQGSAYKPRVTSAGEAMAKTRYPCRSRLLISSRDSNIPTSQKCILTVRMHHHVAHEPYIDLTQSPEAVQEAIRAFEWVGKVPLTSSPKIYNTVEGNSPLTGPGSAINDEEESEGDRPTHTEADGDSNHDMYESIADNMRIEPQNESHTANYAPFHGEINNPNIPLQVPSHPTPSPPLVMPPGPDPVPEYHGRMKAHIKNLREFCDGLEYQLQFNDYRMLDVLENEGGPFLDFVAECLRKEGRLVPTHNGTIYPSQLMEPMPMVPLAMHHLPHHHHQQQQQHHQIMHQPPPSNIGIDPIRPYHPNPGINPRALNY